MRLEAWFRPDQVSGMQNIARLLFNKIQTKTAQTGIIGLGSMGLPLAVKFAKAGFRVTGFDWDVVRVAALSDGHSHIPEVPSHVIQGLIRTDRFRVTIAPSVLRDLDIVLISVPASLGKTKDQDHSGPIEAVKWICQYLHPGQLIIFEGTNYPRATEETVRPLLEASGLKAGRDFFLAFSPELRGSDPKRYRTRNIRKAVSGVSRDCTHLAQAFYEQATRSVSPVSPTPA
jgi:UDP-N-acetyl-D-glucosamine dehydrogenase